MRKLFSKTKQLLLQPDNFDDISLELVKSLNILFDDKEKCSGEFFEAFLEDLFSLSGYKVFRTPGARDGGVDLLIHKGNEKYAIQAKKRAVKATDLIGKDLIQKFNGCNVDLDYKKVIITTYFFSDDAMREANISGIELIDRYGVLRLIGQLQPQLFAKKYFNEIMKDLGFCEKCGAPMTYAYYERYNSHYYKCLNARQNKGCQAKSISEKQWNLSHKNK